MPCGNNGKNDNARKRGKLISFFMSVTAMVPVTSDVAAFNSNVCMPAALLDVKIDFTSSFSRTSLIASFKSIVGAPPFFDIASILPLRSLIVSSNFLIVGSFFNSSAVIPVLIPAIWDFNASISAAFTAAPSRLLTLDSIPSKLDFNSSIVMTYKCLIKRISFSSPALLYNISICSSVRLLKSKSTAFFSSASFRSMIRSSAVELTTQL